MSENLFGVFGVVIIADVADACSHVYPLDVPIVQRGQLNTLLLSWHDNNAKYLEGHVVLFTFFSCRVFISLGNLELIWLLLSNKRVRFLMRAQLPFTHLWECNTLSRCICAHHELFTGLLHNLKELLLHTHLEQKDGVCKGSITDMCNIGAWLFFVCRMWLGFITGVLYYFIF